jgi:hypothetical protein
MAWAPAMATLGACAPGEQLESQSDDGSAGQDRIGAASEALVTGPKRGIHLPNRWNYGTGLTDGDRMVLQQLQPGMVVTLSDQINPTAVEYLRDQLPAGAEIFVRWVPEGGGNTSSAPPSGTYSRPETGSRYYANNYATSAVPAMSASAVADSILALYDLYNAYGLMLQRWLPGNEPELEWNALDQFDANKWRDINAYYSDIQLYVNERKGGRNIELYTPGLSNFGSVGVSNYWPDGAVTRKWIEGNKVGLDYCMQMIDLYHNYAWHSYFSPARPLPSGRVNGSPAGSGPGSTARVTRRASRRPAGCPTSRPIGTSGRARPTVGPAGTNKTSNIS